MIKKIILQFLKKKCIFYIFIQTKNINHIYLLKILLKLKLFKINLIKVKSKNLIRCKIFLIKFYCLLIYYYLNCSELKLFIIYCSINMRELIV